MISSYKNHFVVDCSPSRLWWTKKLMQFCLRWLPWHNNWSTWDVLEAIKTRKYSTYIIKWILYDIRCDFVGSWMHCGYHLTTSIVAPPLLSLPYAFTFLGWTAGILSLVIGALVTFYSYNLISRVLEHHAQMGKRQLRFRDMARDILGTSHYLSSSCVHFVC